MNKGRPRRAYRSKPKPERATVTVSQDGVRFGISRVASGESAAFTVRPGSVLIEVQEAVNGPPGDPTQRHRKQEALVTVGSETRVVLDPQD